MIYRFFKNEYEGKESIPNGEQVQILVNFLLLKPSAGLLCQCKRAILSGISGLKMDQLRIYVLILSLGKIPRMPGQTGQRPL
ncbi:hypothetical protein CRP01_26540 [Flavilitoribacter nigricans DSM 23189 = NBRC 102662]|uniref:Uncharacterized protein n=1 Tax=Flavilitoribacter nigricans (strain ATCC 23147 / DSM 23189 / NBRC 102662 / NCIMB 1420 / SS-2) TaxID=1122177 RepID=A0A2D0N5X4_FLAN2|nr:hypothetical protein CRP01_26540 [Flavilitoribacter nigricans DSM 23189 = NBRC 102662]